METHVENAAENVVWRNFRNGDSDALAQIFREQYDSLYYYGMKLTRDEDLVKDCIQNVFLKLWTRRDQLGEIRYVKAYLLKTLQRHISDEAVASGKKKNLQTDLVYEFDITFSHEDFLIAAQISKEQGEALARFLNQLSKRQREALFLKFYEGLDYEKIADVMALNVQSVRNLIHQSLKSLKEHKAELMPPSSSTLRPVLDSACFDGKYASPLALLIAYFFTA